MDLEEGGGGDHLFSLYGGDGGGAPSISIPDASDAADAAAGAAAAASDAVQGALQSAAGLLKVPDVEGLSLDGLSFDSVGAGAVEAAKGALAGFQGGAGEALSGISLDGVVSGIAEAAAGALAGFSGAAGEALGGVAGSIQAPDVSGVAGSVDFDAAGAAGFAFEVIEGAASEALVNIAALLQLGDISPESQAIVISIYAIIALVAAQILRKLLPIIAGSALAAGVFVLGVLAVNAYDSIPAVAQPLLLPTFGALVVGVAAYFALESLKQSVSEATSSVKGSIEAGPIGQTYGKIGEAIESTKTSTTDKIDQVKESTNTLKSTIDERVSGAKSSVEEKIDNTKSAIDEKVESAKVQVSDAIEEAGLAPVVEKVAPVLEKVAPVLEKVGEQVGPVVVSLAEQAKPALEKGLVSLKEMIQEESGKPAAPKAARASSRQALG